MADQLQPKAADCNELQAGARSQRHAMICRPIMEDFLILLL